MSDNEKEDKQKNTDKDKKEETEKKNSLISEEIKYGGENVIATIKEIKGSIEKLKIDNQKDIAELEKKLDKLNKELEKANKNKEDEEEKEKQKLIEGSNIWAAEKDNVINSLFNKIKENCPKLIKKIFEKEFKSKIEENVTKILFNIDFKNNPLIKEKHSLAFKSIKNSIDLIETLNFIVVGMSGAGKSCLINALFKKEVTKEATGICPGTEEFIQCLNPDVPWLLIYDTFGLEPGNRRGGLEKIKKFISDKFTKDLEDPKTSLHGIIYCIINRTGSYRFEENEINIINELNDIYGESGLLTITFTQSIEENEPPHRKEHLLSALNNEGIKIIEVLAKPNKIRLAGNREENIPQFGLNKLTGVMIDNSEKIIRANLKHRAKTKIINHIKNETEEKFKELEAKFEKNDYKINFLKELENIIQIIFGEIKCNFKDLNLNFEKLERELSDVIEELEKKIIKKFIKEYKNEGLTELNEKFSNLNNKYDKKLEKYFYSAFNEFCEKFSEFCEKEISEKIKKDGLIRILDIMMNKSIEIFSQFISGDITNEEINELVQKNIEIIKKKRNYEENK